MRRLAILAGAGRNGVDAIRDYSRLLCEALRNGHGVDVELYLRRADGGWVRNGDGRGASPLSGLDLHRFDAVVLQYNPFLYGRWGFAPWLPWTLRRSSRQGRPTIGLMVHEPYVPMGGVRQSAMGTWQRAQLRALLRGADVLFFSIEAWMRALASSRSAVHLPVGSNLPDRRESRGARRDELGVDGETTVLATLRTAHPSRLDGHLIRAANEVAGTGRHVVLLNLGAGAPPIRGLTDAIELSEPGELPADELASHLAAADVFMAPFVDGVSTRRGSLMAALQHCVAVVGTDGELTDSILRGAEDALSLVPVDRPDLFAAAAVELATDDEQRRAHGEAGRVLYEGRFDWPVVARRLMDALGLDAA